MLGYGLIRVPKFGLGQPALARDARFIDRRARAINRHELLPSITAKIKQHSTAHWIETLDNVGIPCGKVNNVKEALESPQSVGIWIPCAMTRCRWRCCFRSD